MDSESDLFDSAVDFLMNVGRNPAWIGVVPSRTSSTSRQSDNRDNVQDHITENDTIDQQDSINSQSSPQQLTINPVIPPTPSPTNSSRDDSSSPPSRSNSPSQSTNVISRCSLSFRSDTSIASNTDHHGGSLPRICFANPVTEQTAPSCTALSGYFCARECTSAQLNLNIQNNVPERKRRLSSSYNDVYFDYSNGAPCQTTNLRASVSSSFTPHQSVRPPLPKSSKEVIPSRSRKTFQCHECQVSYKKSSHLICHMKTHTGKCCRVFW